MGQCGWPPDLDILALGIYSNLCRKHARGLVCRYVYGQCPESGVGIAQDLELLIQYLYSSSNEEPSVQSSYNLVVEMAICGQRRRPAPAGRWYQL